MDLKKKKKKKKKKEGYRMYLFHIQTESNLLQMSSFFLDVAFRENKFASNTRVLNMEKTVIKLKKRKGGKQFKREADS